MIGSWKAKIANQALTEVGFSPIDDVLNSKNEGSKLIQLHLDSVILRTLSDAKFEILNTSVSLSSLKNSDGYRIPPDLLRFIGLAGINISLSTVFNIDGRDMGVNKSVRFPISSGMFFINIDKAYYRCDDSEYSHLIYTSLDESRISPQLHDSIVLNLAAKISNKMSGGDSLKRASLSREARIAMSTASAMEERDNSNLIGSPPIPFMGSGRRRM